jgi:hypothetical protein
MLVGMVVFSEKMSVLASTVGRIDIRNKYSAPARKCKPYFRFLRKNPETAEKKFSED